jgi:hypothetical protein
MRPLLSERPAMQNLIKEKLDSTKKFVQQHQTKILATTAAVTTTVAVLQRIGLKQHNDFLKEKGLHEEFYSQTDNEI